jgi:hypothetical protein
MVRQENIQGREKEGSSEQKEDAYEQQHSKVKDS